MSTTAKPGVRGGVRLNLPGLKRMRAAAKPGECICCGEAAIQKSMEVSARQKRQVHGGSDWQDTCGSEDCKMAWVRLWRRDARRRKPKTEQDSDITEAIGQHQPESA